MQLRGQEPKFKDLKTWLWGFFRKQAASSIIYKPLFCHSCEKERRDAERKDYQEETFFFTTKLCIIRITGFERHVWAVLGGLTMCKGL